MKFKIFTTLILLAFPALLFSQANKNEFTESDSTENIENSLEEAQTLADEVTAETVIQNYIEAIGGKENLEKIEDVTIEASTNMNGMEIKQKMYKKSPNKYAMIMLMNGKEMMRQSFNGERGISRSFQGTKEIIGTELEDLKVDAALNLELKYNELGVTVSLESIENVEGKDAYKIKVVNPSGKTVFDFYDVDSGLKIRSKETIVAPQGEFTQMQSFSDYQNIDGVLYPFTIKISGVQNMILKIDSVKLNTGLEDDIF